LPRVVPSQVVAIIDTAFPGIDPARPGTYNSGHAAALHGMVSLARQVPPELITGASEYLDFILCIEVIERTLQLWLTKEISTLPGMPGRFPDPVQKMRNILAACRDDPLPQGGSILTFIPDPDLRHNIARDIRAADDALSHGEWKAATVLAGSAIEALLHWRLQSVPKPAMATAIGSAISASLLTRNPPSDPDRWDLHDMVEVAGQLKILSAGTLTTVRQAKDYRNLIHPGRSVRLRQVCNRSTALVAVAALEQVVAALS
jgi:hypothetical protein